MMIDYYQLFINSVNQTNNNYYSVSTSLKVYPATAEDFMDSLLMFVEALWSIFWRHLQGHPVTVGDIYSLLRWQHHGSAVTYKPVNITADEQCIKTPIRDPVSNLLAENNYPLTVYEVSFTGLAVG
jgi:hypothetical protein